MASMQGRGGIMGNSTEIQGRVARIHPHRLRGSLLDRRQQLAGAHAMHPAAGLEALLDEVDDALARLESDGFGLCTVCHDPIETERLMTDPLVEVCLGCLTPEQSRQLEHDLETAARIQQSLLPDPAIAIDGWDIAFHYAPLGPVSGDHCDLVHANDGGSLFFLFGDVSGKGVSASLHMAQIHAIFRSLIPMDLPLGELMARANRLFCESSGTSFFATLVGGRIASSGNTEIINAGHCAPMIVGPRGVESIRATGLPLGLFCDARYECRRLHVDDEGLLFLYTDGLTEAENSEGEAYGTERLGGLLKDARFLPARETIGACLRDLRTFQNGMPRTDDLTVMSLRRTATSSTPRR
jgi:sigma-B regulation protein RsbU (phosphoserine phosphatase)